MSARITKATYQACLSDYLSNTSYNAIILKEVYSMFGKIFKAVIIVIVSLALLGALWDLPLLGMAIKVVISAGLIAWIGYTIYSFKEK